MIKKSRITHPEYGDIEITRNPRARRIILRARPDAIYITLPTRATKEDLAKAIDRYGSKLAAQRAQMQTPPITRDFKIEGELFSFGIKEHEQSSFVMRYKGKEATLLCPAGAKLATRQEWLKKIIKGAMRRRAQETLPQRLHELATRHKLQYGKVSIRDSHTRWGSCSSKGDINLSIYLMMLPAELIDYVLLHELCHTLEMNHSERFWHKLNNLTGGDSTLLRSKLRRYKCDF